MLFLAPGVVAGLSFQWGNSLWTMGAIWILGSITLWRLQRFHICAIYVVSFLIFALLRSIWTGQAYVTSMAPITGPMYQLFIFFMITDPKTTVSSRKGQCLVAFLVAGVEMVFRLNEVIYAPFYALFFVGPAANAVEIWRHRSRTL
jgi:Na+-translocating ferredoxin:NAD+ oxidoreductase RnfD subunit